MPPAAASPFATFAATADAISATTSKLAKRDLLAAYLLGLPAADVQVAATFFAGRPLPGAAEKLGLGWVQLSDAVARASGAGEEALRAAWLRHSDVGDAAADLLSGREPEGLPLTVAEVDAAFRAMSEAGSAEPRTELMAGLLARATPDEARYLGKIAARELRIGLREGLLEEAIASAFDRPLTDVRRALMLVGEPGEAAGLARMGRLGEAALHLGRPVRFMLATPVADAAEVVRRVGDEAWIEDKYDGIRCQLHLDPQTGGPRLFSRDLIEVTRSFPEVVAAAARIDGELVLDGELVPFREGSVLDFASLQTRLGRVKPSAELVASVPVVLVAFDLLHRDGRDLLDEPLRDRRTALEELALPDRTDGTLLYSHLATARGAAEVDAHFDDARGRHNEGLMIKDPGSTYQPGRRGLGWLKLKRALATLDCVVVGVEWGHGKRRGVLSDYTFAVLGPDGESLLTIGKAYTGLTDAEIARMTEYFLASTIRDHGRYRAVHPEVVVEIAFDRIQRSSRHRSGFALRFPRIVRIRADKRSDQIDDLATVERLFEAQASGRILLATGAGGETERIAASGHGGEGAGTA
ncbi:MAG TPA: ATP-dependent DNA ligase [Candidatus Limnocylindria bacterium]|nr:ATP-dependent DNA ligase [Candidatus Limnocylindria bacterium]